MFGLSIEGLSIILIALTLGLSAVDFFLTHLRKPKSDIIFKKKIATKSNTRSTRGGEVQMELYFLAQNRGEDTGHITDASLDWIECYNESSSNPQRKVIHREELGDHVYGSPPIVVMNKIVDTETGYTRESVTLKTGETAELQVIPRIFALSTIADVRDNYEKVKAKITFTVVDGEREYEVDTFSESLESEGLEPPRTTKS